MDPMEAAIAAAWDGGPEYPDEERERDLDEMIKAAVTAYLAAACTDEAVKKLAHHLSGPHEWGYRDVTDGSFVRDDKPFDAAATIAAQAAHIKALTAERDEAQWALHAARMSDDETEARIRELEARLAAETDRCARIAEATRNYDDALQESGGCLPVGKRIAAAIRAQDSRSATDEGWTEWKGGECPISDDSDIEVKLRDGRIERDLAVNFRWDRHPLWSQGDIIAYRVVTKDEG